MANPTQTQVEAVVQQIEGALEYMHKEAAVLHLDVKPSNILWNTWNHKAVLADFSISERLGEKNPTNLMYCSLNYRPPELLQLSTDCRQVVAQHLVPGVDWWSFGCVVWELASACYRTVHRVEHFNPGTSVAQVLGLWRARVRDLTWAIRIGEARKWRTRIRIHCGGCPSKRVYY